MEADDFVHGESYLLSDQLDDLAHVIRNIPVALPLMGAEAIGAVLDAVFGIGFLALCVQSARGLR